MPEQEDHPLMTFRNCGGSDTRWIQVYTSETPCPSGWVQHFKRMYAGKGYWINMIEGDMYAPI